MKERIAKCPDCKSTDWYSMETELHSDRVDAIVTCNSCGKRFVVVYNYAKSIDPNPIKIEIEEDTWSPTIIVNGKPKMTLPHGSGIDCDWETAESRKNYIFTNFWHFMNENGYYDGYIKITVRIAKKDIKKAYLENSEIEYSLHVSKADMKNISKGYPRGQKPYFEGIKDYIYDRISFEPIKAVK